MRILIVSYYFFPFNTIASVRITKLAEYWHEKGHDVFVLTANNLSVPLGLTSSFPQDNVIATGWLNVNALPEKIMGGKIKVSSKGFETKSNFLRLLGSLYKDIINIPDGQIGWLPYASRAGDELISKGWKPDLIYASALPITTFFVASRLAKKFSIPWIAEYRDLWTDNHNYKTPFWRRLLNVVLEKMLLKSAVGAITVSRPLANLLSQKTNIPIEVVMNGFDPKDFLEAKVNYFSSEKLNIVYTGMIYPEKQDLSILFRALSEFNLKDEVRMHFFGRYLDYVSSLAKKYNLENIVNVLGPVTYKKSISIQKSADVLLFLTWNDKNNPGILTGKIFEYFGARRPILAIGREIGIAGEMILNRKAGVVAQDTDETKKLLNIWIKQKMNNKKIPDLLTKINKGLSRHEQFKVLDQFLISNGLMQSSSIAES
jgi:glycosyltransferase involved in cell wall biosynthesis